MNKRGPDDAALVERAISRRRSTRAFKEVGLNKEDLERIIDAGIAAPSGSNSQNQRFILVTDREEIDRIGRARFVWPYKNANQGKIRATKPAGILGNASALIIVLADAAVTEGRDIGEFYIWESIQIQNCSAAIENMLIMATALGLGSCWVSASDRMNYCRMLSGKSWRQVLSNYAISPTMKMQGVVLLGVPKQEDEEGFPAGEKMHGATAWMSVARKERDHYMVSEVSSEEATAPLSSIERLWLFACSKTIHVLLKVLRRVDKMIWRVEMKDARNVAEKYNVEELRNK